MDEREAPTNFIMKGKLLVGAAPSDENNLPHLHVTRDSKEKLHMMKNHPTREGFAVSLREITALCNE
eukprot:c54106_g1_i1 orf=53-253(+)